jgi:hypothetical protein
VISVSSIASTQAVEPTGQETGWPQSHSTRIEEERNFFLAPRIKPRFLGHAARGLITNLILFLAKIYTCFAGAIIGAENKRSSFLRNVSNLEEIVRRHVLEYNNLHSHRPETPKSHS